MKTFKKLFSVSAIVALLGTLAPMYAFGANYTTELVQAYDYAYGHKITTMSSIDNADMYGNLTRIAMAKMLANYAIDVLGLTPDTTKECTFPDVSAALDAQYDNWVTKACQLGLMGVGITNFNPNGLVTRAEFGTAFSRALNANDADKLAEMNKADPYYKDHLNFLKEEGIMTKIDTPSQLEVRGYVMLMMMRSDSTYTPTEGCSAEELLKCLTADDYDACIAECSDGDNNEEVVTGNGLATVSRVGSANTVETPLVAINVKVGTIKLTAGEYDTKVSAVEITKGGLWSFDADELQLALRNENIETEFASVSTSTDKVKVKFSPALTIKAGKSETFDVVANFFAGTENGTYTFSVTDLVVANGKAAWTPVQLWTIKTTSAEPKTVDVTIDDGAATIKAGDTEKLIAKINVVFDKSAGKLDRIGLVNVETVDTAKLGDAFDNVNAYVDGKKVGKVSLQDEKIIISDLNMNKAKDEEVNIELKADAVYDNEYADFLFKIDSIDIVQEWYDFGLVPYEWWTNGLDSPIVQSNDVHVVWNNITFKKVALTTKEVLPWTKNVVLYDATFKSAIDARITDILIEGSSELDDTVVSEGTAKIVINGEEIELDADDIIDSASVSVPLTNKKIDVDANTEVHVKIILSTKKPASTAPVVDMDSQYKVTLEGRGLENINNTFATNPVQGDKVTVKEWTAEIVASTVTAPATRSLFPNKDQEAGRFGIKADGDALTLNEITLSYTTSLDADDFETLFDGNFSLVDVDTDEILSADFDLDKAAKELKISNIKDYEITKDETANLKLMVNLGSLDGFYGDTVKFTVKANSIDAKTSVRTLETNATYALTSENYKLRMVAPEIELTKMSEKKFKVVIKNTDKDTAVAVKDLRYRVVTTVADSDFKGSVCLTTDANLIECESDTHAFWARGTELSAAETISAKGSITYYIVVDGTSIEPEVLQADISSLTYDGEAENYSVSAK